MAKPEHKGCLIGIVLDGDEFAAFRMQQLPLPLKGVMDHALKAHLRI